MGGTGGKDGNQQAAKTGGRFQYPVVRPDVGKGGHAGGEGGGRLEQLVRGDGAGRGAVGVPVAVGPEPGGVGRHVGGGDVVLMVEPLTNKRIVD